MSRFELSQNAFLDLTTILAYSEERWGKARARIYVDAMQGRLTELARHPLLGRTRDDLADGLCSFPFESHVVFYQRAAFGITVVRILHNRQNAEAQFD